MSEPRLRLVKTWYSTESYCGACERKLGGPYGSWYPHQGMRHCPFCGVYLADPGETEVDSTSARDSHSGKATHPLVVKEQARKAAEQAERDRERNEQRAFLTKYEGFTGKPKAVLRKTEKGSRIGVLCGGRGPSNEGDPYGLHVVMQWEFVGEFDGLRKDDDGTEWVKLKNATSSQFKFTNKKTGEPMNAPEMDAPLNLVAAVVAVPA